MANVLVVDDNIDTCRILSAFLTRGGHRSTPVTSVSMALEKLDEEVPDLIITDLMMPYQNGMDLIRRVRKDARLRDIPVIMYSAVSEPSYVKEAMASGATDYWLKGSINGPNIAQRLAAYLPPSGWAEPPAAHPIHVNPA